MQYFHMSRLTEEHVNEDNALVFVEGGEFDKQVMSTTFDVKENTFTGSAHINDGTILEGLFCLL